MSKHDYNLVVIGAGAAGLVSAYIAATLNAKVVLIEKNKMGGDCLNTGCVPSKALIKSAEVMSIIERANMFGLKNAKAEVDFPAIMNRIKETIQKIEPHDSTERYEKLGLECLSGEAKIIDAHTVKVGSRELKTKAIILATGAEPFIPPIEGLSRVSYLTSDNLWNLTELPKRLLVLGGGPIGCEMAQSFSRLGSDVTILEKDERLMAIEDKDVSEAIHHTFEQEGINIKTHHEAINVAPGKLIAKHGDEMVEITFDSILIAVGRTARKMPEWKSLGIKLNEKGIPITNDYLQTSIPNIYACGDIIAPYQFTHIAAHEAWYASVNALLGGLWRFKAHYGNVAWATFTHPSIARLGINEQDAKAQGIAYEVTRYNLKDLDRAITDENTHGFIKVLTKPKKDVILGVTIVGENAENIISEFILSKQHGLGLNKILSTMHIYPTLAEANKYIAGEWKKSHKPEWLLKLARLFFSWKR